MREIVLDTETTGLDPARGDRIVEIGALELFNHLPTGQSFHTYLNPERNMPAEAQAVHGLSTAFLADKPAFAAIGTNFLDFIGDSVLIIHNASFDVGFLNAELGYQKLPVILPERVIDTLQLARQKHPGAVNSLDALCRRYGIDNSKRTKHGALLDSELLAEVYLELIGGRQAALNLVNVAARNVSSTRLTAPNPGQRPVPLPDRVNSAEKEAHALFVNDLGEGALWKNTRS